MKASSLASRPHSLVCPFCEMGQLRSSTHDSMRCRSCEGIINGALLQTLRQITALPDALASHACEECAHPQMRLLPDGTYHCPSCGSEVMALGKWKLANDLGTALAAAFREDSEDKGVISSG
jgi:ribosomal protein L37AE/L43A